MKRFRDLLIDLDGTLLGLDIERFLPVYLGALSDFVGKAVRLPDFPSRFMGAVATMVAPRDDERTNEEAFYGVFRRGLPEETSLHCDRAFLSFYEEVFPTLRSHTRPIPGARGFVRAARAQGLRLTLATSPVFPRFVIEERLRWAGIAPDAFAHITSFENAHFNKPDPRYYGETLETLGARPEETLMIGNDLRDDGAAVRAGVAFAWIEGPFARRADPAGAPVWHGSMHALERALEGGEPPFTD